MALKPTQVRELPDELNKFAHEASLNNKKEAKKKPNPRSFTLYDEEDSLVDTLSVKAKIRLTRTDVIRIGIQLMDDMTEEEFREIALAYRQKIKHKRLAESKGL